MLNVAKRNVCLDPKIWNGNYITQILNTYNHKHVFLYGDKKKTFF